MELSALLCHRVAMPKSGTQTINLMVDSLKVHIQGGTSSLVKLDYGAHGRGALMILEVITKFYNRCLRPQQVGVRNLVLRKVEVSNPIGSRRKVTPSWECPYRVT
ncbi:hypothetical protein C4D60_Mb11t21490 [Musa balbisiana]|uniref:Uncharacterized protein n=1 Tax=Musa balbisiana TaxID=52838 RepID=A0A4S8J613_MUSBA|nr:hypothetical protein C4D60_Mb11t21490 [Musa balbisiana]